MTHTETHTGKRADKNNGEDRTYLPQYTERKGSKIPENRQTEHPDTLRNQQVRCSSHPTSSKMNDPTQFEQVDETCGSGRVVLHLKSLGMTVFFEDIIPKRI